MPVAGSVTLAGRRVGVVMLVSALLVVPIFVRAGGQLHSSSPSPIRLSRGFELPPTKCHVAPPAETAAAPVRAALPTPVDVLRRAVAPDEAVPDASDNPSPDTQRGPPSLAHA
jgi:hypothetical protein